MNELENNKNLEHSMDEKLDEKEDAFYLLSELHNSADYTQRELSIKLKISLGKVNYLLKELIKRGFISVKSFSTNPNKLKKVSYVLTKKGFQFRLNLVKHFLHKKEEEYNQLKREWEQLQKLHSLQKEVHEPES